MTRFMRGYRLYVVLLLVFVLVSPFASGYDCGVTLEQLSKRQFKLITYWANGMVKSERIIQFDKDNGGEFKSIIEYGYDGAKVIQGDNLFWPEKNVIFNNELAKPKKNIERLNDAFNNRLEELIGHSSISGIIDKSENAEAEMTRINDAVNKKVERDLEQWGVSGRKDDHGIGFRMLAIAAADTALQKGDALFSQNKISAALKEYLYSFCLYPDNHRIWEKIGECMDEMGHYSDAIACNMLSLRLYFSPDKFFHLRDRYLKLGDTANARNALLATFTTIPPDTIEYSISLDSPAHVKLRVFNILGQMVSTIVDSQLESGDHIFKWDMCSESGDTARTGIYYYRLEIAGNTVTTKMMHETAHANLKYLFDVCDYLLQNDSTDAPAWTLLGKVYVRKGDYETGIDCYNNAKYYGADTLEMNALIFAADTGLFISYVQAANGGDSDAECNLGAMYYKGRGVPQDNTEALRWFRASADKGNMFAQYDVGLMYDEGLGVPENDSEAAKWYTLAADQGDVYAQLNLGTLYYYGSGVPQSSTEAAKWYRLAADQGSSHANLSLGDLCYSGDGLPQDYTEAFRRYWFAAGGGNAEAQYKLGHLYDDGLGVVQDYGQAKKWYLMAIAGGQTDAQTAIGDLYHEGKGVVQDSAEALRWHQMTANDAAAYAYFSLGELHRNEEGVGKDLTVAAELYGMAAESGLAIAQRNLGEFYENGWGIPQDFAMAYVWYGLAAAQQDTVAQNHLFSISSKMSPDQISQAQARLAEKLLEEADSNQNR
ncbi:MAG: SEL1-like repeat protein [candidate division Zixibacteria bacterium]|nr:SEL1-like repeat protein [candidate division Zixibacteria bacterium]